MMCMICLQGNGKLIFQGIISYLACILITYLGFAMMRFGNIEQKYMRKLDGAAHSVSLKALVVWPSSSMFHTYNLVQNAGQCEKQPPSGCCL